MKVALFDVHRFERRYFETENTAYGNEIRFFPVRLTEDTAPLAFGFDAVCPFVEDHIDERVIRILKVGGIKLIALRSAGFNNVDLNAARNEGIPVVRVPRYSPHAVAEYATTLVLALNRKIHRAYVRTREGDFSLDGLVGFDLHGKTVGVIGTGQIGSIFARIMSGFGCKVLGYDSSPDPSLREVAYLSSLSELLPECDIVSLHLPLTPETHHLIDADAFNRMKRGAMLINTGRGALVDTRALVDALKSERIGAAGLDVYEEEENVFFRDLSREIIRDDVLARLLTFPNVLITSHQGFLTHEALRNIAQTTLRNIREFEEGRPLSNPVIAEERIARSA